MIKLCALLISLLRVYGVLSYSVIYTHMGDNVTLPCGYASRARYLCWYKQAAGEQPQIIASHYVHSLQRSTFQLEGNQRFSVQIEAGSYDLKISNIQQTDSAIYYCGRTSVATTELDKGTFLVLKESTHISFQQQVSESAHPGDSVTLNCTVHTGTSNTQYTVYWFRDSRSSGLGVMYVHANGSGHCVNSLESGSATQRCMYSVTKRNVSVSDAGMYYCAVASCGEILFGNGTRLDLEGNQAFPVLMLCIVAALLVLVIMNITFITIVCKTMRGNRLNSREAQPQTSVSEDTGDTQNEESDALQYVALDFKKKQSKRRRHQSTEEATVYSPLRMSELK